MIRHRQSLPRVLRTPRLSPLRESGLQRDPPPVTDLFQSWVARRQNCGNLRHSLADQEFTRSPSCATLPLQAIAQLCHFAVPEDAGGESVQQEPLSRFSAVRTHDADELRQRMAGLFSVRSMDFGRGTSKTFRGHLNHRQLRDVGLMYARYGAPLEAYLSHGDSYLQGFPLRGHGQYVLDGTGGAVHSGGLWSTCSGKC